MNILPQTAQCQRCICREIADLAVSVRLVSDPANGLTEKRRLDEKLAEYMRLVDEQAVHIKQLGE